MKKINSSKAPDAVGPYSQGIDVGGLIFLSGQIAIDKEIGQLVEGGIEAQTHQVFKNIQYVLEQAELTLDNVVKVTVLLANMDDFAKVNAIYGEYFEEPYPARSAFAVKALPLGAQIEIEVIAAR